MDVRFWAAMVLCGLAGFGTFVVLVQRIMLTVALSKRPKLDGPTPPVTILKPMAGNDDDLYTNVESYAELNYPDYEVLLGVRDTSDEAYAVAQAIVKKYPNRFTLYLQEDSPGANPKVNQLATLARHAKHELLVISDSNTRSPPDLLRELAAIFQDPEVGMTSNPVTGMGHQTFPALMDNLYMATVVGAGQLASKELVNKDLVVGKSMAFTRTVLTKLGGFESFANYLAEDYVMGVRVRDQLKMKVVICKLPVWNIATKKTMSQFRRRYRRWAVIHRTSVTLPTSIGQFLLTPWPLTVYAMALWPSRETVASFASTLVLKQIIDLSAAIKMQCRPLGARSIVAGVVKDFFIHLFWWWGLFRRKVMWRGNALRVQQGSRLVNYDGTPLPEWKPKQENVSAPAAP